MAFVVDFSPFDRRRVSSPNPKKNPFNCFRKTLHIRHKRVRYILARKSHGAFHGEYRRVRNQPGTQISEKTINLVYEHIKNFQRME